MDKAYSHKENEEKTYKEWEEKGYFKPEVNAAGKPYCIILPPPNANAPLHFGHAMYVIEDVLARYFRMKGLSVLWLPGADHAGFETQFVFEKKLKEEGKSRFDYNREALYQMIWDFVQKNRGGMEEQLRRLGFSLDWSRAKFTLDKEIVKIVYKTFKRMHRDGLIYRAERLVNYCTHDGTSFSDLEVVDQQSVGTLYHIAYPLVDGGEIVVATTRPETLFGDAAVMVNPDDARYKDLVGKTAILPLAEREVPIISDEAVQREFGTGAVKVTPLHDFNDWEVAQKHKLDGPQVIALSGKMQNTGVVDGLYVGKARAKIIELLKAKGFLKDTKEFQTVKRTCYKCKNVLEPLPLEQWFIKMEPLAKPAIEAVKNPSASHSTLRDEPSGSDSKSSGQVKIYPKNFEKLYFQFLEGIRDWNISRQIVWGIRIPAWKNKKTGEWMVTEGDTPDGGEWEQDEDTFDTWFSSAQWPYATLQTSKEGDCEKFYPTTVMETGYDILRWWVARMIMVGIYATGEVPFKNIVLHGLVNDPLGKKMSKSKGNVTNPIEIVNEYGADAVRMALLYGTALGHDQSLSYPKIQAMRNFTNKLWNMGRFVSIQSSEFRVPAKGEARQRRQNSEKKGFDELLKSAENKRDREIVEKTQKLAKEITELLEKYDFNHAAQKLYEFAWHEFADKYIEDVKDRIDKDSYLILTTLYLILLKLLHPFMPFVTEKLYKELGFGESIMIDSWPV